MLRPIILCALLLGLPASLWAAAAPADPPPSGSAGPVAPLPPIEEAVSVSLLSFRARLVDPSGAPIPDLKPGELEVRVGGSKVPVVGLDYFDQPVGLTETPDPEPKVRLAGPPVQRASVKGQLVVLFVEAEAAKSVVHRTPRLDLRRPAPKVEAARLLTGLPPGQRIAVVRHDDRLRLALDFTTDRDAVRRAVEAEGAPAPASPALTSDGAALHLAFDEERAKTAAGSERALALTAEALNRLPGEKVLIYLGIGPGTFQDPTVAGTELETALHALQDARTAVFVLQRPGAPDRARTVLGTLSGSTGGTYTDGSDDAVERLAKTVRGYHLVLLNTESVAEADQGAEVTVSLIGRKGAVLMSPLRVGRVYE